MSAGKGAALIDAVKGEVTIDRATEDRRLVFAILAAFPNARHQRMVVGRTRPSPGGGPTPGGGPVPMSVSAAGGGAAGGESIVVIITPDATNVETDTNLD